MLWAGIDGYPPASPHLAHCSQGGSLLRAGSPPLPQAWSDFFDTMGPTPLDTHCSHCLPQTWGDFFEAMRAKANKKAQRLSDDVSTFFA